MKRWLLAGFVLLGTALALSPDEVWALLARHQQVEGYQAVVAQGPLVYKVAFLRPKVRLEWIEGPEYLVGQVMIVDGETLWSRDHEGRWKKSRGAAPLDPVHLLFADIDGLKRRFDLEVLGQKGNLLELALTAKEPPDSARSPARWVFRVDLKRHLPLGYQTFNAAGKPLAEVVYRELDPTPPPADLFKVGP